VERLDDGEVSGFLHEEVVVGDELELRGPIGQWFVWSGEVPALLIGGGSGAVPLMSMLRFARQRGRSDLLHLVTSVRTPADLYYASELPGPETTILYTRDTPVGWPRQAGRITLADLTESMLAAPRVYVCGSSGFANAAISVLESGGVPADRIRVEQFGATG
jgi:ferredoxin-NADP reductase